MGYSLPKIVYPSGGGTTLQFVFPPRSQTQYYQTTRHDNLSSAGVKEAIFERTDTFQKFTMEYVRGNILSGPGEDIQNWAGFMAYALQGGSFDYYPDPINSPSVIHTCTLEQTDWTPEFKQLGMFTFNCVFRYRVAWP